MDNTILKVVDLKTYFPLKKGFFQKERPYLRANDGVSFSVKKGETFGLVGESGCGKSTLGRAILGLCPPTSGQVLYTSDGRKTDLTALTPKEMRPLRSELQMIFQDPYSSLNPRMTVGQMIAEGVFTHGYYPKGSTELRDYVLEVMQKCGLQPHMMHRYPHQFSGGQRQRVSIARALAVKPKFVVCDECVSALDVSIQAQILNLLSDLKEREGLTYLFISHDLSVVRHISDRLAVMYLGKIMEMGDAERVFENPRHPYTISLISASPSVSRKKEDVIVMDGKIPSAVSPPKGCPFYSRCFMAQEMCQRVPAPLQCVGEGHTVACHFAKIPTDEKREIARKRQANSLQ